MSRFNDAWFINESLSYFMSTSSFSNSVIESDLPGMNHHQNIHEKAEIRFPTWTVRCKKLCDNFNFSVKSKIYVVESNLRGKIRGLKNFFSQHLPCISAKYSEEADEPQDGFEDNFWKYVEPNTRETLGVKKEKILNRLEQVIEANRNCNRLFNMDQPQRTNGQIFGHSGLILNKEKVPSTTTQTPARLSAQTVSKVKELRNA